MADTVPLSRPEQEILEQWKRYVHFMLFFDRNSGLAPHSHEFEHLLKSVLGSEQFLGSSD